MEFQLYNKDHQATSMENNNISLISGSFAGKRHVYNKEDEKGPVGDKSNLHIEQTI